MKRIDCRGIEGPKVIKKVKKYFDSIGEGEATVRVDNDIANSNITKYAMTQGYHVDSQEVGDEFNLTIESGHSGTTRLLKNCTGLWFSPNQRPCPTRNE